jgi:serine acetyltransferase
MTRPVYPKNRWVVNSRIADFYFLMLRWKIKPVSRVLEWMLGTEINCPLPKVLFMPHPYGIIVGRHVVLRENVVLMQQVTLGGKKPHLNSDANEQDQYPKLEEGAYIGAGAKVLGNVEIGAWAVVAANAVVTKDVPAFCTAAGIPARIIKKNTEPDPFINSAS